MDISFFDTDNTKILANEPNAYEWWYADFIDKASGISGVIIFYNGNLFSPAYIKAQEKQSEAFPENYPAISVSLYKNQKPYYYSFLEHHKDLVSYSEKNGCISYKLGADAFNYDEKKRRLEISLNQVLASGEKLKLDLRFRSNLEVNNAGINSPAVQTNSTHSWKCILPSASVNGQLSLNDHEYMFEKAVGYHDHNAGLEPLHHYFKDWYWGRFHLPETAETLIFYSYSLGKELQTNAWIIDQNNGFSMISKASYIKFKKNLFGLRKASRINLSDRFEITINKAVDKGPFYERYLCSVEDLQHSMNNTNGFAEYIFPKNIYKSWAHKLVNLRLRYTYKKPHSILRNKLLYQFTWKLL